MEKVLNRLLIEGIGCLIFAVLFLVSAIFNKGRWYDYVLAVGLLLSGITFLYKSITIRKKMHLKKKAK